MEQSSTKNAAVANAVMRGGAVGGAGGSPIVKVRRDSGFYDAIPWDKVDYWKQEGYFQVPAANVGPHNVYLYVVRPTEVILLTSVVFRIEQRLVAGPTPQYAFMHDDALRTIGFFEVKVGGQSVQLNGEGNTIINRYQDIYQYLNQDIMVPQLPFIIAILPSELRVDITFTSVAAAGFFTGFAKVELRGVRMAKGLYDKLSKEFAG